MSSTATQRYEQFWRDGFVSIPNAISATVLTDLNADLDKWVEESRSHRGAFGAMQDGRPRFDVEPGHSARQPALRRVAAPTELSEHYLNLVCANALTDCVADVLGPNLRLHHCKINCKLPKTATTVSWHQDFTFDPHSNDDMVTAFVFLNDMTNNNGPLRVVPGSHRGPLFSLWHDGNFTGAVSEAVALELESKAMTVTGEAGTVCLMHVRVAHSSGANRTTTPRNLFIAAISAADAVALAHNAVPSRHEGMIIRGQDSGWIRACSYDIEMPEVPTGASFFEQQASAKTGSKRVERN